MNISIILNNIQDPRRNHLQKHSLEIKMRIFNHMPTR